MSNSDTTIALEKADPSNAEITDASLITRVVTGTQVKRERVVLGSDADEAVLDLTTENTQEKVPVLDQGLFNLLLKLLDEQRRTNLLLKKQLSQRINIAGFKKIDDGNGDLVRISNDGSAVVQASHETLCEATLRGRVFSANVGTAGALVGAALTTTPPFTLYNPMGSKYILNLIDISLGLTTVNAPPQGSIILGFNPNITGAAPVGGTALTPNNNLIGGRPGVAQAFNGATLNAIPTPMRAIANMQTSNAYFNIYPWLSGSVIVPPGTSISMQAVSTPVSLQTLIFGAMWEEIYIG